MNAILLITTQLLITQTAAIHEVDRPFLQEIGKVFSVGGEIPGEAAGGEAIVDFPSIAVAPDGSVVASAVSASGFLEFLTHENGLWKLTAPPQSQSVPYPYLLNSSGKASHDRRGRILTAALDPAGRLFVATSSEMWDIAEDARFQAFDGPIRSIAAGPDGAFAVGTENHLFVRENADADFTPVYPADARYSWAPREVSAVAYDSQGRLWFGSREGVGVYDGENWNLYTGSEGLPYDHFTCAAPGINGEIWFGTERGAIRFDGERWAYRANRRWLPDDRVNGIAVQPDGTAWIATPKGIGRIQCKQMTLEEKAAYFIDQVETRHCRDGYITDWQLTRRGDVASAVPKITDNDGEYTASYGSVMAFRYAVTGDPKAKELARRSFLACKRLVDIVPESMKGFPARVLIPIDWHEPVNEQYNMDYNRRMRKNDPFWKLLTPRFVTSEDGKYYWKCDTSSDELAGHYFIYGIYYDLVAETEAEKEPVRQVVRDVTDHLIRNGYNLIDHDGKPTRWGRFGPDYLLTHEGWEQRGLNSLMMLSFLATAEHVTGDPKYAREAKKLRDEYGYHINAMHARPTYPPENVVPWDHNLGLKCYYPLMKYEDDPELLLMYRESIDHFWKYISKQKSPLWNFIFGACAQRFEKLAEENYFKDVFPGTPAYLNYQLRRFKEFDPLTADCVDTLRDLPLELIGWKMYNSHRLDVELDPTPAQEPAIGWSKVDQKSLPINERGHVRQDRDNFALDLEEGDGHSEHEGTFYLLPYYLGRYHGFL